MRFKRSHLLLGALACVALCSYTAWVQLTQTTHFVVVGLEDGSHVLGSSLDTSTRVIPPPPGLMDRSKAQRKAVDEYCSRHPELGSKFILPKDKEEKDLLYRHLLFDYSRELMFCFVEKIGCTDMKRFMFIAAGALSEKTASHEWVDLKYLEKGIKSASLQNKNLTDFKRLQMIQQYSKFTILRHPLERLVSGFRNKIEPTLTDLSQKFPNPIKHEILRIYRNKEYDAWFKAGGSYNISVRFSEFVQYFLDADKPTINPHFKPFIYTCHPCRVRYDFYGNFGNYGYDVRLVAEKFGLNLAWYRNKSLHASSQATGVLLKKYYDQLSQDMKKKILFSFNDDLEFYFALYPEERGRHEEFLN